MSEPTYQEIVDAIDNEYPDNPWMKFSDRQFGIMRDRLRQRNLSIMLDSEFVYRSGEQSRTADSNR